MELTPYVRYRNARRECADLPLEPGDFRTFTDDRGRLWWRTAVTHGTYASAAEAAAELSFIEDERKPLTRRPSTPQKDTYNHGTDKRF